MRITSMPTPILTPSSFPERMVLNRVSNESVVSFKKIWCDENEIIVQLILEKLHTYFQPPILDVGAGIGDIAFRALKNKDVICLDKNKIDITEYPLADGHTREQVDFFFYVPQKKITTVLFSHSLQFLDDDIDLLQRKLDKLSPSIVVIIHNRNDGLMGELVKWSLENDPNANPEIRHDNFPKGYAQINKVDFEATLTCDTFESLAEQVSYLMLLGSEKETRQSLITFLKSKTLSPQFPINQSIEIYEKR